MVVAGPAGGEPIRGDLPTVEPALVDTLSRGVQASPDHVGRVARVELAPEVGALVVAEPGRPHEPSGPVRAAEQPRLDAQRCRPVVGAVRTPDPNGSVDHLPRRERRKGPRDEHLVRTLDAVGLVPDTTTADTDLVGGLHPTGMVGPHLPGQARCGDCDDAVSDVLGAQVGEDRHPWLRHRAANTAMACPYFSASRV